MQILNEFAKAKKSNDLMSLGMDITDIQGRSPEEWTQIVDEFAKAKSIEVDFFRPLSHGLHLRRALLANKVEKSKN